MERQIPGVSHLAISHDVPPIIKPWYLTPLDFHLSFELRVLAHQWWVLDLSREVSFITGTILSKDYSYISQLVFVGTQGGPTITPYMCLILEPLKREIRSQVVGDHNICLIINQNDNGGNPPRPGKASSHNDCTWSISLEAYSVPPGRLPLACVPSSETSKNLPLMGRRRVQGRNQECHTDWCLLAPFRSRAENIRSWEWMFPPEVLRHLFFASNSHSQEKICEQCSAATDSCIWIQGQEVFFSEW